jgi:hypothetical protein
MELCHFIPPLHDVHPRGNSGMQSSCKAAAFVAGTGSSISVQGQLLEPQYLHCSLYSYPATDAKATTRRMQALSAVAVWALLAFFCIQPASAGKLETRCRLASHI